MRKLPLLDLAAAVALTAIITQGRASAQQTPALPVAAPMPDLSTTESLYDDCKSPNAARQAFCTEYLFAAVDVLEVASTIAGDPTMPRPPEGNGVLRRFGICRKDTVSGQQIRQMFVNWAEAHPEGWQEKRGWSVWVFLHETWACPQ